MRRALVTGATGLVGSYTVERLLADGWVVRVLVRDPGRAGWLAALGVELVTGDVHEAGAVRRAATGCEAIVHAAAVVSPHASWAAYRATNVEGTRNVVRAARASGARLLHVSSVAVYGAEGRYRDAPTDEAAVLEPLPEREYYARSKREAEHIVLEAHQRGEIWAVALRPSWIYGKRDRQFIPRVAMLFRAPAVPLINGGRTTLPLVHAANVVDGGMRALATEGAGGQTYNVTNDYDVTLADLVRLGAEGLGLRIGTVNVPLSAARAGLGVAKVIVAVVKGRMTASQGDSTLIALSRNNPFSSDKARGELAWDPPVRPEVGIPEAFRWYREHTGAFRR